MVGKSKIGDQIRPTRMRFRNNDYYETYIKTIDQDYESDDSIFIGYFCKINTPQFNLVNRSQYGNGCNFKKEIIEYRGNICFNPSKLYCFIECIKNLIGGDNEKQCLEFIRNEKRRSKIKTMARIQPCLRKLGIDLGHYNGKEICLRKITESNRAVYLHNNQFCLIWKS